MKFIITAKKEKIDKMCKDLDKEIEKAEKLKRKAEKIKKSRAYKVSGKLAKKALEIPLYFSLNYRPISNTKIELTVIGLIGRDKLKRQIIKRANSYGGVAIKVVE